MLAEYAANITSYSGEDGMIRELCARLGLREGFCVEFGAGDGLESSNTLVLRDRGWGALLVEGSEPLYQSLIQNCPEADCQHVMIEPTGVRSIDALLTGRPVDLMSIDVDGADYFIFEEMQTQPTVLLIEYNQSVPWFLDVRAANPSNRFGASSLSLYRLALRKGYSLVGVTETNMIFVASSITTGFEAPYRDIMEDLPFRCGFVVSDFTCSRIELNMGNLPNWGWRSSDPVDDLIMGDPWKTPKSRALSDRFQRERVS